MKLKFNWGTGIFLFLVVFLLACAAFIYFAFTQDVNLVHKDYYEKGVNYTEQMEINARSIAYQDSVAIIDGTNAYTIIFAPSLAPKIDSGEVLFYYPANSSKDVLATLEGNGTPTRVPKSELQNGRYVVKIKWFSGGLKYEVEKTIIVERR